MNNTNQQIDFSSILKALVFVLSIWLVYIFELTFDFNFNKFGVLPRSFLGLRGIFFSPFIHSNTNHLLSNSLPSLVLISSLFIFYKDVAYKVLICGGFTTGFITWLIARESYHIGASGIVYLLFSFIFFSGIIKKHYSLVALSLTIIFLYGSMVWYVLPLKDEISWEGHLSGFIVGLIFAIFYRKKGLVKQEYQFSKTEFDTYFDEYGNLKEDINDEIDEQLTKNL